MKSDVKLKPSRLVSGFLIYFSVILPVFFAFLIMPAGNSFAAGTVNQIMRVGGYRFKTDITPRAQKFTKLKLTLFITRNGVAAKGLSGKVSLSMPAMYMGKNIAQFNPVSGKPGEYKTYIYFTMGGLWKLDYILHSKSGRLIRFSEELTVN